MALCTSKHHDLAFPRGRAPVRPTLPATALGVKVVAYLSRPFFRECFVFCCWGPDLGPPRVVSRYDSYSQDSLRLGGPAVGGGWANAGPR